MPRVLRDLKKDGTIRCTLPPRHIETRCWRHCSTGISTTEVRQRALSRELGQVRGEVLVLGAGEEVRPEMGNWEGSDRGIIEVSGRWQFRLAG
jgi:hypothetical protein